MRGNSGQDGGGEGVKKSEIWVDVVCARPKDSTGNIDDHVLRSDPYLSQKRHTSRK